MWKVLFFATLVSLVLSKEEAHIRKKRQFNFLRLGGFGGLPACFGSRNPFLCRQSLFIPNFPINTLFPRATAAPAPPPPSLPFSSGILFNGLVSCFVVPVASRLPGRNCNFPNVGANSAPNIFASQLQATGGAGVPLAASGNALVPVQTGATGPGGVPIAAAAPRLNAVGLDCRLVPASQRLASGCGVNGITANRILGPVVVPAPVPTQTPLFNNLFGLSLSNLANSLNNIRVRLNSRTTTVATPTTPATG